MKGDGNHRGSVSAIEECLPLQRGNVNVTNRQLVNAILYVAEHGCKWRARRGFG